MKTHTRTRILTGAIGLLLALSLATAASALEDFQFTEKTAIEVGNKPEVELESVAGDVTYTATNGTKATVEIIIDVRAEDENEAAQIRKMLDINVNGADGRLEASVKRPEDFSKMLRREFGKKRSISVSFHVTGPKGASGHFSSVSGDVNVEGIAGPAEISTVSGHALAGNVIGRVEAGSVSGDVEVSDCGDRVRAKSVSGDVQVEDCRDDVTAGSVSGSVYVSGVLGSAVVSTVSGRVDLENIGGEVAVSTTSGDVIADHESGDMTIETVSGDISARSESNNGELVFESTSGSVEIFADTDHMGRVALSTFSGDIRMKNAPANKKKSKRGFSGRGDLHLTLGNGELDVKASTHSGDIWIREL